MSFETVLSGGKDPTGCAKSLQDGLETQLRWKSRHYRKSTKRHVLLENDRVVPTLFDAGAYSNYQKILRITAWVIRFANNVNKTNDKFRGGLGAVELDTAERYWVKQVQKESFETDIMLRKNGTMDVNPTLAQLHPFFDNNKILRARGRLLKVY